MYLCSNIALLTCNILFLREVCNARFTLFFLFLSKTKTKTRKSSGASTHMGRLVTVKLYSLKVSGLLGKYCNIEKPRALKEQQRCAQTINNLFRAKTII